MNKNDAAKFVDAIVENLKAEGFTEAETKTITQIATTTILLLQESGAPLGNRFFVPGLKVASSILAAGQAETKTPDFDNLPISGTKH